MRNGQRIAVAIKPVERVVSYGFTEELEHIAASTPKQFADKVTGKSCAVAHLISRARVKFSDQGISDGTLISLRVPSPATLKFMGQMVLRALGYNLAAERQAWYIWDLVRHQLRERQVLFLHLDEAQDLSSRGTKHELNSVASMLKTLMTDEDWPVGILLSGTSELEGILSIQNLDVTAHLKAGDQPVLSGISFDIAAGEVLGVIGESGSGMTVLSRTIVNWLPVPLAATKGEVLFRGQNLLTMPDEDSRHIRGREIAYIGSDPSTALDPTVPIGQHLVAKLMAVKPELSKA